MHPEPYHVLWKDSPHSKIGPQKIIHRSHTSTLSTSCEHSLPRKVCKSWCPGSNETARENVDNIFSLNDKVHHDENNMDEALIERFYDLLDPTHASNLREVMLAHFGVPATFIQTFESTMHKWGTSTATSHRDNRNIMVDAWYPNGGMTKLWRHLKTCASYGYFSSGKISDTQLRDAALIVINKSRAYKKTYLTFKQ